MSEEDKALDADLALLLHAMMGQRDANPHYTLPEPAMREYARLVRADERKKCAERIEALSADYDRDYREYALELAAELVKDD